MIDMWKTKNGEKTYIKDMTTEHIKNCIKAIQEDRIQVGKSINIGYTGDGDGDGAIYEWYDMGNDYIKAFEEELKRRKVGDIE